jgi:hypothetical protein
MDAKEHHEKFAKKESIAYDIYLEDVNLAEEGDTEAINRLIE